MKATIVFLFVLVVYMALGDDRFKKRKQLSELNNFLAF